MSNSKGTSVHDSSSAHPAVECPICGKPVYATSINAHLDSGCTGTSSAGTLSKPRSSSPDVEIISQSTPTGTTKPAADPAKPLASIFSARKRETSPAKNETQVQHTPAPPPRILGKRSSSGGDGAGLSSDASSSIRQEKKPRVNPLTANQPCVNRGGEFVLTCRRLAERSRPTTLEAYIGQEDIVGPQSLLRARLESGKGAGSLILWGPPGSGKT